VGGSSDHDIEEALDELQRESQARRAELQALAAQLPEVLSRRALLRAVVADARANSGIGELARRLPGRLRRMLDSLRQWMRTR
jgi:chorismate mutase